MTLSFRVEPEFADQTSTVARFVHQNRSDYIKQAVSERNERVLAERIAFLSKKLSAQSLAVCEEMDAAAGDGLA